MSFDYDEVIEDLKSLDYDFRLNDLDEGLEVQIEQGDWDRFNDTHYAVLKTRMRGLGYGSPKKCGMAAMTDALTTYAHSQRHNPIKSYFENLRGTYKPRKGETLLREFCTYFTNPDGQLHDWLFYWMTGTIAKIFRGERNPMLVLVAPQRVGKSYFCGWLCPIKDRFLKSPIAPDKKDSKLRLTDVLVWEVEELGATTRRADIEALKHFITLPFIYERFPYGRYPLNKPVSASFIGTVNFDGAGFLNDPTGTTRFLACEIEKIDFGYTRFSKDELWAEALHFYDTIDGIWQLSADDEAKQARINRKYETISALEDALDAEIEVTRSPDHFMATLDIKDYLAAHYRITNENAFNNELARILYKRGAVKGREPVSQGQRRGWFGVKRLI